MELIHKQFKSSSLNGDWVITIGNFDGYHLGHQALVNQVLADKKVKKTKGGVLTFDPHPKKVLQSQIPFRHIYSNQSKWRFLEESGLDACFIIPFTAKFAALNSQDFLNGLFNFVKLRKIVVGYDFNFGKAREGSASFMKQEAEKHGIEFQQLEAIKIGDITVSSTMIRRLLFEGDFKNVRKFLGRQWSVSGIVQKGKLIGNTIGFPTMNLEPNILLPLKRGVFICQVDVDGTRHKGVCNVGVSPTFNGKTLKVETHLFDFNEDVYGKEITVYPVHFVREEKKFNSVDELKEQIQRDAETARHFFINNTPF
ncbi:bifunctional riboflavin kinase/FAD synthetase [bacterium]|nr:bifunctional riboflavin kinase/FAD synthetase [bacterium]